MAPIIWAVVGFLFILSEFLVPEFVIFFFGVGALLMSLLTALAPPVAGSVPLQILIWLGLSAATLFGLRKYLANWFKGRKFDDDDQTEYVGKSARVTDAITPDKPGRISFRGTTWVAESFDERFERGQRVEILRREGMHFIVTESILGLASSTRDESDDDEL